MYFFVKKSKRYLPKDILNHIMSWIDDFPTIYHLRYHLPETYNLRIQASDWKIGYYAIVWDKPSIFCDSRYYAKELVDPAFRNGSVNVINHLWKMGDPEIKREITTTARNGNYSWETYDKIDKNIRLSYGTHIHPMYFGYIWTFTTTPTWGKYKVAKLFDSVNKENLSKSVRQNRLL